MRVLLNVNIIIILLLAGFQNSHAQIIITAHPRDTSVVEGESAVFTVIASGIGITYQWFKNNILIDGATNSSYTTPPVNKADDGSMFKCVVKNDGGEDTSDIAILTVMPIKYSLKINYLRSEGLVQLVPDKAEYDRGEEVKITAYPKPNYLFEKWTGDTSGSHSPLIIIMDKNREITANFKIDIIVEQITIKPNPQWPNQDVTMSVSATSMFDLTYEWFREDESLSGKIQESEYVYKVKEGDEGIYYCVVLNDKSKISSDSISLKLNTPVHITEQPGDLEGWTGKSFLFEVGVNGTGPFYYQWQKLSPDNGWTDLEQKEAQKEAYGKTDLKKEDEGKYRCIIRDEGKNVVTSRTASLEVKESITITKHPEDKKEWLGKTVTFRIETKGNTDNIQREWLHNDRVIKNQTDKELTINIDALGWEGIYKCRITDGGGSVVTSDPAELNVLEPATIVKGPVKKKVYLGEKVSFSVQAKGEEPIKYQWFHDDFEIKGKKEHTITIDNASKEDEGSYSCRVSNDGGSDYSEKASLLVDGKAKITEHPEDSTTVFTRNEATLAIKASGSLPIKYEWQFNNKTVSSQDLKVYESKYVINAAKMSDEGKYRCIVSNSEGTDTSGNAELTVRKTVEITKEPQEKISRKEGETARFSISASGYGNIKYQWQKYKKNRWSDLEGKTKSTLEISSLTQDSSGQYRCIAKNGGGEVASRTAYLIIEGPVIILDSLKDEYTGWTEKEITLSIGISGSVPIIINWYKTGIKDPIHSTGNHSSPLAELTLTNLKDKDKGEYYCIIDNSFNKPCRSKTTKLIIKKSVRITEHPKNVRAKQGDEIRMNIKAEGDGKITYQWLKDGIEQSKYISKTLIFEKVSSSQSGLYQCIATNEGGSDTSKSATLKVEGSITITQPSNGDQWRIGTIKKIKWICEDNSIKLVEIWFSKDGGKKYEIIGENVDVKDGEYQWLVQNIISSQCKIKISSSDDDKIDDETDGFFKINTSDIPIRNFRNKNKLFSPDQIHIFPNPAHIAEDKSVNFSLSTSLKILSAEITIYDALGNHIIEIPNYTLIQNNGKYRVGSWDLLSQTGQKIHSGSYLAVFTFTDREGHKLKLAGLIGITQ
jgi:hypothetical protein